MKSPSELNTVSPQNSNALIFANNAIDLSLSVFYEGPKFILPVFASEDIVYLKIRENAHKNFE